MLKINKTLPKEVKDYVAMAEKKIKYGGWSPIVYVNRFFYVL